MPPNRWRVIGRLRLLRQARLFCPPSENDVEVLDREFDDLDPDKSLLKDLPRKSLRFSARYDWSDPDETDGD